MSRRSWTKLCGDWNKIWTSGMSGQVKGKRDLSKGYRIGEHQQRGEKTQYVEK